ncbi:MAG: DUF2177 family protein [Alphaproteobacteria bacterium]|nr:DUF2177 family protein [Alphaproteobacteria bacterium]
MKRLVILYIVTFAVILPLDFLFLGVLAKDFFRSQVGDMLGTVRLAPAILFYLLYVVGILIFVSGNAATAQTTLLYGALFGFFCYATYDLTNMATMKVWTLRVTLLDIAWGTILTGITASAGALVALRFAR